MPVRTGASLFVEALQDLGIRHVFGIPGGTELTLVDEIGRCPGIDFVLTRSETAASYMCDAIAKATGEVALCLSTAGPGATNLCTGLATSRSDSTPALSVSGQISTRNLGRDCHDEIDMRALFAPVTKANFHVRSAEAAGDVLHHAYRVATSGRGGPCHIAFPADLQAREVLVGERRAQPAHLRRTALLSPDMRQRLAAFLDAGRRIALLCGGGCVYGGADGESKTRHRLVAVAEALGAPVFTTYNGKGAIDEESPFYAGRIGELSPSHVFDHLQTAEAIIALGCRFTDVSTNQWKYFQASTRVLHVDIDPAELGRQVPTELVIEMDVASFLGELSEVTEARSGQPGTFAAECASSRERWRAESYPSSGEDELHPKRVMSYLDRALPDDALVVADAGSNKRWAANFITIRKARRWVHSGGFAPMGYALSGAVGLAIVAPKRPVVAVTGDGAFQMTCAELATAVDRGVAPFIVVLNDGGLGIVRELQHNQFGGRCVGTRYRIPPSCADIARAFGAEGVRVTSWAELEAAVALTRDARRPVVADIVMREDHFLTDMYEREAEDD